jgi:LytS/YehU family sensor histidine kinase
MEKAIQEEGNNARRGGPSWLMAVFGTTLLVQMIGTSIAAVQKWQNDRLWLQEEALLRKNLEQQQISSELSFLKAQLNPHFFFNTLHTINALMVIHVESSRQALLKLSRMMRYVLYETQRDTVLLSQEIAFIQDYITLMQLRLTDKVAVTFQQPHSVQETGMAPMLFLPFVENAFKHGISTLHASCIFIAIRQQDHHLELEVRNTMWAGNRPSLEPASGIGLANTRRRLDLLYPDRYQLSVRKDGVRNEYRVHLTLCL